MVSNNEDESFTDSKKDILKFLKIIGVDMFISLPSAELTNDNLQGKKKMCIFVLFLFHMG